MIQWIKNLIAKWTLTNEPIKPPLNREQRRAQKRGKKVV